MRIRRGWIVAGVVAAALAGEAAVYGWIDSVSRPPGRPDTASLSGGRVTFRIPPGWQSGACPGDGECMHLRTPHGNADAVTTPVAQPATTSVSGTLPDGSRIFIWCVEKAEPRLVRSGCEAVIGALHVRR